MTLAASGTISLAGTATDRSIQVALGGDGTTQISMNDTAVRALGDQTGAGSAINMSTDFYGKSAAVDGITARYIRLTGFTRSVAQGPFISQFALYTAANLTTLIIGQNANSSPTIPELSANNNNANANRVGSISFTSGWYLAGRATSVIINDWIQYDMGSPITIGSILVRNGYSTVTNNYWATGFNVEHSNDGTNWTLIQAVTNTSGPTVNTINT